MAYHIYSTKALILKDSPQAEADKSYMLFTRDLGLIYASARSVRRESSKLRYALQPFSRSTVSLVRGKNQWRITNAAPIDALYASLKEKPRKLRVFAQICALLRKFIAGEEKNETLFDLIEEGIATLVAEEFIQEELDTFECIWVLRILNNLGYVNPQSEFSVVLTEPLSITVVRESRGKVKDMIRAINHALASSQL